MNFPYRLIFSILASAALAHCVLAEDEEEDEDTDGVNTFGFFKKSPNSVNVSLHYGNGPAVKFGNLGEVPVPINFSEIPPSAGVFTRTYMNGTVVSDSLRTNEQDATVIQTSTNGSRYEIFSPDKSHTLVSDNLAYTKGVTRSYSVTNNDQVKADDSGNTTIDYNYYSATSEGGTATGSKQYAGGVDLAISHVFSKPGNRIKFSLVGGVSMSNIHSETTGTVTSALHIVTDTYTAQNLGFPAPDGTFDSTVTPHYKKIKDPNGIIPDYAQEDTNPLYNTPDKIVRQPDTSVADAAEVSGIWKVRGAYYTVKLGPQISTMITPTFGITLSAGVSGAYSGTTYSVIESFTVTGIISPIQYINSSDKSIFLPGYYAYLDANWSLNERSGLFAGVSYESYGSYEQKVDTHTAKIDLGNTVNVRGGMNIKF